MQQRLVRIGFLSLVLLLAVPIVTASPLVGDGNSNGQVAIDVAEVGDKVAGQSNGTTAIVTSPGDGGKLLVVGPDGRVTYRENRYTQYYDVDPLAGKKSTVEFVALDESLNCPPTVTNCKASAFVRVNLTTGDREVLFKYLIRDSRVDIHDFDRVDEHRLLIANINDEVFIYNTTSQLTTWSYDFHPDYDPKEGGLYEADWTHLNDVEWLGDGRIMASPRNMDEVIFLSLSNGMNGSMTLGEDGNHSVLYEQHNPDFIPKKNGGQAVLVADSENNRVVEYQRKNGEWQQSWMWQDSQMSWPRDADRLPNGNTLITDSNGNRVIEVNEAGEIVWSLSTDTPYEAERLETGDESTGGESAAKLSLDSRRAGTIVEDGGEKQTTKVFDRVVVTIKGLLPSLVVNGLLFVLPSWMTSTELIALTGLLGVAGLWAALEAYWYGFRLRSPVARIRG